MRHLVESKRILLLIGIVILAGGCAGMIPDDPIVTSGPEKTASTMTQAPEDYHPETTARRADRARMRTAEAQERAAAREAQRAAHGGTIQAVPARPMTRAERALAVLRRSPLGAVGRFVGRPFGFGRTTTTPAVATDTTGMAVTDTTPRTIGSTPQVGTTSQTGAGGTTLPAGPSANPGAGRVIVGQPVETGSGIRSTVTGTPTEPMPGGAPTTLSPTEAANVNTAGNAAAASSPGVGTTGTATPPVGAIAPGEPAPGTAVTNTGAATTEVEVKTNPDGTPVITNEEPPPPPKKRARKTRKSGS